MVEVQRIVARTRKEWRGWLARNHLKEKKVEVIVYKKHTGKPSLSHREYLEEALCFGWIDTIIKRFDNDCFLRTFCRRNDGSRWSANTLRYAKQLLAQGCMSREGIKRYKEGLSRKTHDFGIPRNPNMPKELKAGLAAVPAAEKNFAAFSPSAKRTTYRWLLHAKLPETRRKRVKEIVRKALKNRTIWNV